jgi:hypothetical protein
MSDGPSAGVLQSLEHVLEALRRTAHALGTTLDVMAGGESLSTAVIADYRQQLANVERDRLRLAELVRGLWTTVEPQ